MQAKLDAVTDGTIRRMYFQIPVRHGKTEHNTIRYPAYRILHNPKIRVLIGSYNQTKANEFSRDLRRLVRSLGVKMSPDLDAVSQWDTAAGGRVRVVGAGAGVAGVNADLIILDDPVGSRDDAESAPERDRVWDWFTNDILARCEPRTAVVMTMSRWHQDDPAGRLRAQQGARWDILDLPAEAEENDPLGRQVGGLLWPEHRNQDWIDEKKAELGAYAYAAMLQGRPRPREGGMFKWAWWQLLPAIPATGPMVRYWDLAGTEPKHRGHDPDYSAGALACRMQDRRTALVDVTRFRLSIAARDAQLLAIARADLAAYPGRVVWWIETEAGIAGADRTADLVRSLHALGMSVYTEHPTGKKVHRAEPLASAAEAGNVVLCPGDWRDAFRDEAANFPQGTHDDQIDAAAGALAKLSMPQDEIVIDTF